MKTRILQMALLSALLLLATIGCKKDSTTYTGDYIVFSWNDLGMHCANPSYDKLVLLPPYNTLLAQVVKRGNPPQVVTSGLQQCLFLRESRLRRILGLQPAVVRKHHT
jgi:hypothetical protein